MQCDVQLNSAINFYCHQALAPATHTAYLTGVNCYFNFLAIHNSGMPNQPFIRPSETLLIYFVVHCAQNLHLAYTTIKSYLAGITNYYITKRLNHPLFHQDGSPYLKLQLVLKGIRKHQCRPCKPRLPITVAILKGLISIADQGVFGAYLDLLMKTACSLAFFGFLRCGEFTCSNRNFDASINLCMSDVSIQYSNNYPVQADVLIKASKCDPFRKGCIITLFKTNTQVCPVSLIDKFCMLRRTMQASPEDPLFILPGGEPLTRNSFLSMLKCLLLRLGLDASKYTGHSFRIGAATSAEAANIPDHLIKTLGRWSSDCYQRYIRTSPSVIKNALNAMAEG